MRKALLAGIASLALVLGAAPLAASADDTPTTLTATERSALDAFHASLTDGVAAGADGAADNLDAFNSMTADESLGLAQYLTGETELSPVTPSDDATVSEAGTVTVATDGDAQWVTEAESTRSVAGQAKLGQTRAAAAAAATYNVHSHADESFVFAGITVSKTRVWADYVTGSGVVKSIRDYGCQLVQNYEPTAEISTVEQSKSLSGGKATFKCKVTVKRGAPTPWGQITWSTRQAYQYMSVNGPGVYAHGWQ